jgi:hypothetical protein
MRVVQNTQTPVSRFCISGIELVGALRVKAQRLRRHRAVE